jgi:hypothetical protein
MIKYIFAFGLILSQRTYAIPHLELEMSSEEYQQYLNSHSSDKFSNLEDPAITRSLRLGERLSRWIGIINVARTSETAIRLTSAQTRRGVPIETPNIYSPTIIKEGADKIIDGLPESMKIVLTTEIDLPSNTGIDDELFIKHARLVDRNYQSAARYKSVNPYRYAYIAAAAKDVRGYYYLTQNKISENELKDVTTIENVKIEPIKEALVKICLNSGTTEPSCRNKVNLAFNNNTLSEIYVKYMTKAKNNWDSFFIIPKSAFRRDIKWDNNIMTVPFNTPSIAKFIPYLQDNIEDEFRFNEWQLKMNFGVFSNGPRLIFESGVVPHVNGLGGNEIVMDSNQPIEEYESQWTIRHEFGHVLGLPDCYHEFYDTKLEAYVNYQLDTSDLMCSRAGNMKERIFSELKHAYAKEIK